MDTETKDHIFYKVWDEVDKDVGGLSMLPYGVCVPMNFTGRGILRNFGVSTSVKAGSFSFPYAEKNKTENKIIKYTWDDTVAPDLVSISLTGKLPELHIWLEDDITKEIIDFSIFKLPDHLKSMGHKWEYPAPPLYIWGDIGEAKYIESQSAIEFIMAVNEMWDNIYG